MIQAEILSVGTELLLGNIVDTNQAFLSAELAKIGIAVYHRQTCGDNRERLEDAVRLALSRSELVLITGGLGPTYDDITKETVASVLQLPLEENAAVAEKLRAFFAALGREMTPNNLSQALIPKGAAILENDWGTAPGIWIEKDGRTVVMMPGVPREMKPMYRERVAPLLQKRSGVVLHSVTLHLYGIGESDVDAVLRHEMETGCNPTIAPYAKEGEVELRITAKAEKIEEAERLCRETERNLFAKLGQFIYSDRDRKLHEVLIERFCRGKNTLALAEGFTGGKMAAALCQTENAFSVFKGGVVFDPENAPEAVFGSGRASDSPEEYVLHLAQQVREKFQTTAALAVIGTLDPEKATAEMPFGTGVIAAVYRDRKICRRFQFSRGIKEKEYLRTLASLRSMATLLQITGLFCEKPPEKE